MGTSGVVEPDGIEPSTFLHAMQTLSQLSYGPIQRAANCPRPR